MSRFTRSQCIQVVVFCLFWFVAFPFIWFVIQPEFFTGHVLYAMLFAVLLAGIYYLIYRLVKCCCTPSESTKTPPGTPRHGTITMSQLPNGNANRRESGSGGNANAFKSNGNGNGVYTATTIPVREQAAPYARNMTTASRCAERRQPPPDNIDDDNDNDEQPFIAAEDTKNKLFVTSCSLYYDGQGRFYDYK